MPFVNIKMQKANIIHTIVVLFPFILFPFNLYGRVFVEDKKGIPLSEIVTQSNTTYIIRNIHSFSDTLTIPDNCELIFKGGQISGPLVFNNTQLSGDVNLKGSRISGSVANKFFDASWICNIDGVSDDARCINDMIGVSSVIKFPKGLYRLIEGYDPKGQIDNEYYESIRSHVGIHKSNVSLLGEDGCEFITDRPLGIICIFSKPCDIENSIRNISIKNITFRVVNDGVNFYDLTHSIKVIGVNGLTIESCFFDDFWGDAVCLSHYGDSPSTGERTRNKNVKIINNCIQGGYSHNNRNGISIINGQNVLIKDNTIRNTSRKDMPGGIDIEPNNSAYTIDKIRIENNYFDGIKGFVGAIGIVLLRDEAPAKRVSIIGNRIENSTYGISVGITTKSSTDHLVIKNNVVDRNTTPYKFGGGGKSKYWVVKGNIFEKYCMSDIPGDIEVKNLVMSNNKKKD